jgi:hypothetical protein
MSNPYGQTQSAAASLSHRVLVRSGNFFHTDNRYRRYFLFRDGDIVWQGPYEHGTVHEISSTNLEEGRFTIYTDAGPVTWRCELYTCHIATS